MEYVDGINCSHGGEHTRLFTEQTTHPYAGNAWKTICTCCRQSVRHLGTDINYVVLENLYAELSEKVDFHFRTRIDKVRKSAQGYTLVSAQNEEYTGRYCIISTGRSGSKWMQSICDSLGIHTESNRVDIGVRVELPADVFAQSDR